MLKLCSSTRLRVISIPDEHLINIVGGWRNSMVGRFVQMTQAYDPSTCQFVDIPDDVTFERVFIDYQSVGQISIVVSHPSFSQVEGGSIIPRLALSSVVVHNVDLRLRADGLLESVAKQEDVDVQPYHVPSTKRSHRDRDGSAQ